jgi:VWFA-related protein
MTRFSLALGTCGIASAVLVGHQASAPPQATPIFRTGVTHVLLDVVVTDKDDRPITDLTADEFTIREGDRVQTISDFEHVSVPLGNRAIDLTATPVPPPDTFSNAPPPRTGRAFQFLMGPLDTADIVPIKRVMAEFLSTLTPDDEVAVTFPQGRSDLNQDFTRDTGLVIRAINHLGEQMVTGGQGWRAGQMLKTEIQAIADAREIRHVIIFVSDVAPSVAEREVFEACELARRLGVPIYTIDPRGLMAPPLGLNGNIEDQVPGRVLRLYKAIEGEQQSMRALAENANGLAFVSNSDLPKAIHELITDNGSYYLLGYYPTPYVADGKYHDVKVTVTRAGAKVRARSGYPTEKPRPADAAPPRLVESLAASVPGGDLILHAFAASVAPSTKGARTLLTLNVAYPASAGGAPRVNDELHLTWLAIDSDANIKAKGENIVAVPLVGASAGPFTVTVEDGLDLPKGRLMIRVAVSSRLLGTQGRVYATIDVPDLSAKFQASPLVLGLEGGPLTRLVTLGNDFGSLPFQPTPMRTFTFGREFRVFARIFASSLTDIKAVLVLKQGETVIKTLPITVTPSKLVKTALDCEASFPMKGLSSGTYALELTVEGGGSSRLQRALAFEVR